MSDAGLISSTVVYGTSKIRPVFLSILKYGTLKEGFDPLSRPLYHSNVGSEKKEHVLFWGGWFLIVIIVELTPEPHSNHKPSDPNTF